MADIIITIPTAKLSRITDAFCNQYEYQTEIEKDGVFIINPQSKNSFAKAKIIEYVKQVTKNYEGGIASQDALSTKNAEIDAISIT